MRARPNSGRPLPIYPIGNLQTTPVAATSSTLQDPDQPTIETVMQAPMDNRSEVGVLSPSAGHVTGLGSGSQGAGSQSGEFLGGRVGQLPSVWSAGVVTPAVSVSDFSACSGSREFHPAAAINIEGSPAGKVDSQGLEDEGHRPPVSGDRQQGSAIQRSPVKSGTIEGLRFSLEVTQRHPAGLPNKTTTLKARLSVRNRRPLTIELLLFTVLSLFANFDFA